MREVVKTVLAAAEKEVDVKEDPIGSNWGPRVKEYLAATGWTTPAYWCAAFVAFVGKNAVKKWPLPRTASCDVLLDFAKREKILHTTPQAGDVFLVMKSATDATHTGFVVDVAGDGTLVTIEGNSNMGGSRNGYMVAKRDRENERLRFVRWASLVADEGKTWLVNIKGKNVAAELMADGKVYAPARLLLKAMEIDDSRLAWDGNSLLYKGKDISAPAVLRDSTAWVAVRGFAAQFGYLVTLAPGMVTLINGASEA